jgi:hypothetical protein
VIKMKKERIAVILVSCIMASVIIISVVVASNLNKNFGYSKLTAGHHNGDFNDFVQVLAGIDSEPNANTQSSPSTYKKNLFKNDFNSSLSIVKMQMPLNIEHMEINAKKIKIIDSVLGYEFETYNTTIIENFEGRLYWEQERLYITGSAKHIKTYSTSMIINPKSELNVEILDGKITIKQAHLDLFEAISTGSMRLNEKFDLTLYNDDAAIKDFEGYFEMDSNGNANLYGQAGSVSIEGRSFVVFAK